MEQSTNADGYIRIRGARTHNLRDVDVDVPRDALVAITGLSGSGKSSLAFDTLHAEGRRRYLESLSARTRQFVDRLERPDVDLVDGLPPTISVDQQAGSARLRSTLATITEVADYLRLLFARAGTAHCPDCGRAVASQTPRQIVDRILALDERLKVMILAPLVRGRRGAHRPVFEQIVKDGFVRARVDGEIVDAADPPTLDARKLHDVEVVVDRIVVKPGIEARLLESVNLALANGDGVCLISSQEDEHWRDVLYSARLACPACGVSFHEPEPRTFSFNSPYGACPECQGLGVRTEEGDIDESETPDFDHLETCPGCRGGRLNAFARSVTVGGRNLPELTLLPLDEARDVFDSLLGELRAVGESSPVNPPAHFTDADAVPLAPEAVAAAEKTLPEIVKRIAFLQKTGLGYLTLDRPARTLSGGEFQRARLAGCLGSGLIGVCYILDEPTIGLHPRDTDRLIKSLEELRDAGNTVIVVEHDESLMRRADHLIDLGPGAGDEGGRVVAQGTTAEMAEAEQSPTGRWLRRHETSSAPAKPRETTDGPKLTIRGARLHNLKNVTVEIRLQAMTAVTGVSGSGKSSLISGTLVPAVKAALANDKGWLGTERSEAPSADHSEASHRFFDEITGVEHIERIVEVDQSPIGRSGKSNPATYSGVWDEVRKVLAGTREARIRGYRARRFSFNVSEGRCPTCKGRGTERIEMHFMPDVHVTCPDCCGDRFNRATLAVRYAGKNAADVLRMRIDEAADFFENFPRINRVLKTFAETGLGYLTLGQSALTLSGGEAQRVKLATELSRGGTSRTLFVLDEPTTGLHPADVDRLLALLHRLVDAGNGVVVIEHDPVVIRSADWVVDLGPEGGAAGGSIVVEGTPADVVACRESHTGAALGMVDGG